MTNHGMKRSKRPDILITYTWDSTSWKGKGYANMNNFIFLYSGVDNSQRAQGRFPPMGPINVQ